MEIEDIIRKLAMRKIRLKEMESMISKEQAEDPRYEFTGKILRNERILIKQAELELHIYIKKEELEHYQTHLKTLAEKREDSYCPACKYMYETPDGRKLTEEEHKESKCTLHPGKEFEGYCPNFADAGCVSWSVYFKQIHNEINQVKHIIQETGKEVSELEKELKSTKLED